MPRHKNVTANTQILDAIRDLMHSVSVGGTKTSASCRNRPFLNTYVYELTLRGIAYYIDNTTIFRRITDDMYEERTVRIQPLRMPEIIAELSDPRCIVLVLTDMRDIRLISRRQFRAYMQALETPTA